MCDSGFTTIIDLTCLYDKSVYSAPEGDASDGVKYLLNVGCYAYVLCTAHVGTAIA